MDKSEELKTWAMSEDLPHDQRDVIAPLPPAPKRLGRPGADETKGTRFQGCLDRSLVKRRIADGNSLNVSTLAVALDKS